MRKLKNEELHRLSIEDYKRSPKLNVALVLDNVRSMHNIGSAFRTADAFRVNEIFLTGISAQPPHREIHKTALGATDSVDWRYFEKTVDALGALRSRGYKIVAIEQADESVSLKDFAPLPTDKYAFVFGNEVFGVEDASVAMSDTTLEIPQFGTKHSLNISVSIGVILWDYFSKVDGTNPFLNDAPPDNISPAQ